LGHATHFLSRLERAEQNHTERAMELYHNPKLGEWLLDQLHLAEHHERFALSLDEEDKGPFLVMSRTGGFVTCLGKGMSTNSLYTVRYERYRVLRQRALDLLENIEDFKENDEDSIVAKALHMLSQQGCFLERELFEEIAALYLILRTPFLMYLIDVHLDISKIMMGLKKSKISAKSRTSKALVKLYWQKHQELGHLLLLTSLQGEHGHKSFLRKLNEDQAADKSPYELYSLLWPGALSGEVPLILRALWGIGRVGKSIWPSFKKILRDEEAYPLEWRFVYMGSLVLAIRHRSLRSEIRKELLNKRVFDSNQMVTFYRDAFKAEEGPTAQAKETFNGWLMQLAALMKKSELIIGHTEQFMREQASDILKGMGFDSPDFSPENIPTQHAFALMANIPTNIVDTPRYWIIITMFAAWLAQSEAKDFYLPRELSQQLTFSPQREQLEAKRLWDCHISQSGKKIPKKNKKAKVTPNEPCPCGSGKKYKRCCRRKSKK